MSSTRAEAVGILAALGIPGPLHIGLDNASAVKRTKQLLKERMPRKPWALQDDGDVWESIALAIGAQGRHSTNVSKLKGHAKDVHVEQGLTTPIRRLINDAADRYATKGVELAIRQRPNNTDLLQHVQQCMYPNRHMILLHCMHLSYPLQSIKT